MSRRTAKVAEAVREIVATTILFGMRDPRVKNVTVLWADAAPDLRSVKIYLSVRGDAKEQSLTMHGLNSARGYIQSQIAEKLELRYTPILQFVLDPGAKLAAETSALLREAMEQTAQTKSHPSAAEPTDADLEGANDDASPGHSTEEDAVRPRSDVSDSPAELRSAPGGADELNSSTQIDYSDREIPLTRPTAT